MPPETIRNPSAASAPASAWALRMIWAAYSRKLWLRRLPEGDGLGRDDVIQRAALQPGEDRLVDGGGQVGLADDRPAPGPTQRLVGRKGHDVGHADRVRVNAAGDQTGHVGGIEEEQCAHLVGDPPDRLRIENPGVGGGAGHDELGPVLGGQRRHLVEVEPFVALGHAVRDEVVQAATGVDRRPVGEVAPLVQPHAEHRVAGLQDGHVGRQIGIGSGVGLHVGVHCASGSSGPNRSQARRRASSSTSSMTRLPP